MSDVPTPIRVPDYLQEVLDEFDSRGEDFRDSALVDAMGRAVEGHEPLSDAQQKAWLAEWMAYTFVHSRPDETSVWGTHFAPRGAGKTEQGETRYFPDVDEVDVAVIQYWERRRDEVRNPVMRARYADLLWDLRNRATGDNSNIEDARIAIDSYLQAVERASGDSFAYNIRRLQRALNVAVSISDEERVEVVRDAMFAFYDRVADTPKIGSWTWLFDTLHGHRKVALTDEQQKRMVGDLEQILEDSTDAGGESNAWCAEAAAKRLQSHYARAGKQDDVQRVVLASGRAFEAAAQDASATTAMAWLQKVQDDYRSVGLKDEAAQVLVQSKGKGKQAREEMQAVETKFEISKEEVDAFVAKFTEGELGDALGRIAVHFVPRIDDARDMMKWAMENTPLLALISHTVISEDQIVAQIGSTEEDDEGRVMLHLRQDIDFKTFGLAAVIDGTRRKFNCTADDILEFFSGCPLFDPQRHPLIREGVDAYLNGDHVKAVHILIPQIEHALRVLLGGLGQPTNKPMRSAKGVMQEKTLTDILEYEAAIEAWAEKNSVQDWLAYLRCFLTDPRGHNLRNRLAHGLMVPDEFGRQVSDRVFHVLLMLSLVGRSPENDAQGERQEKES